MGLSVFAFAENMDEIVVFEQSEAFSAKELPANIQVIDQEKIKALAPLTTVELLEAVQGVSVKSFDAKHMSVDMGGYGADKGGLNNVIMINGRRITSPDMSGIDWSFIPVDSIERIEVYQGGNSVAFGDRATGGVINIVTKKPVKSGFSVKVEGGSYGTDHGHFAGQYASDRLALIINADKYDTAGYRDNSELRTNSADGDLTYYFDKGEFNIHGSTSSSKYGLPGSLTYDEMSYYGRQYSKTPDDGGEDYEYMYGAGGKLILPVGELHVTADLRKRHRDYTYNYLFGSSNTVDNLKSKAFNHYYTVKTESGSVKNTLTAGIDYIKYDVDAATDFAGALSGFDMERKMTGYYAFDKLKLGRAFFEAGYRDQRLKDDFKSENRDKDESESAYNASAGYDMKSAGKIYVKFDRSFRFPTTDELREYTGALNPELKTQTADEISVGWSFKRNVFYASARAYAQDTDNEIFTNPSYFPYSNYNLDTKRKGADVTAGISRKGLTAELTYSYVDADIDEGDYEGKEVPLLSKDKVKALVAYKAVCGFGVSYAAKYYSSTYAGNDVDNTQEKLDSYWIHDVKLSYAIKNFDIYFKVNNLFNEKYYDYAFRTAYSESYYPAPDRNYTAGVSYKF